MSSLRGAYYLVVSVNVSLNLHCLIFYSTNILHFHCFCCTECNKRFGDGTFTKNKAIIIRKCNQKCWDAQKRMKKVQELKDGNEQS